jgi:DNA-binding CsgD family transcriptional regulator
MVVITPSTEAIMSSSQTSTSRTLHLFLTRGLIAIAWAAVFAAVASSLTTDVTVGAGILLACATCSSRTSHGARCADIDDPRRGGRARRASSRTGTVARELSDAELRVGYLPSNLTAAEIASELVVSTNTVRTHMRHIYAKLDAHSPGAVGG